MSGFALPSHLSQEALRFFHEVEDEKNLESLAELHRLLQAAEMFDRAEHVRQEIGKQGVSIVDRFGKPKPNPLLETERRLRANIADIVKTIRQNWTPKKKSTAKTGDDFLEQILAEQFADDDDD